MNEYLDFGDALKALKQGKKVARVGWNGKGMFLTLQQGSTVKSEDMRNENAKKFYGEAKKFYGEDEVRISSHIDMKAVDDTYIVGWLASQTDMLAEDWFVLG